MRKLCFAGAWQNEERPREAERRAQGKYEVLLETGVAARPGEGLLAGMTAQERGVLVFPRQTVELLLDLMLDKLLDPGQC